RLPRRVSRAAARPRLQVPGVGTVTGPQSQCARTDVSGRARARLSALDRPDVLPVLPEALHESGFVALHVEIVVGKRQDLVIPTLADVASDRTACIVVLDEKDARSPALEVEALERRQLVAFQVEDDEVDPSDVTFEQRVERGDLHDVPLLALVSQLRVPLDLVTSERRRRRSAGPRECGGHDPACFPAIGGLRCAIRQRLDEQPAPACALEEIADAELVAVVGAGLDEEALLAVAHQIPEQSVLAVLRPGFWPRTVAAGDAPAADRLRLAGP